MRPAIEIAREFHTLLLGGIPVFDARRDDAARRFVTLVDELYDRNVNLVCTAAAEPAALYEGERLVVAFERNASRLIEMRSAEYLAGPETGARLGPKLGGKGTWRIKTIQRERHWIRPNCAQARRRSPRCCIPT